MYSFEFDYISQLVDINKLKTGCFLCVWHAHKIPPHIGLLIEGKYFSLKVKGKDSEIEVDDIVKLMNRKSICSVFVEIKSKVGIDQIKHVFSSYFKAEVSKFTCLTPITEVFNLNNEIFLLADLLNYFKDKNQIGQQFGLNLIPDFKGIPSYGREEIEARLKQLSKTLD